MSLIASQIVVVSIVYSIKENNKAQWKGFIGDQWIPRTKGK